MPNDPVRINRLIKILYIILGSVVILGVGYVLWVVVLAHPPIFSWSQVHAYFVLSLESLALIFLYDIRFRMIHKERGTLFWPILLVFFVLNIVALWIFGQYYGHPERTSYDSVKIILKLLPIAWLVIG